MDLPRNALARRIFYFVVLIVFAFMMYLTWNLIHSFLDFFNRSTDTVKAASIAAFGSVSILVAGRWFEQRRESARQISNSRIKIYSQFFEFYFSVFYHEKIHGTPKPEKEVLSEMLGFQRDVLFWGSDRVIRAYLDMKDTLASTTASLQSTKSKTSTDHLASFISASSRVLVEMRRDVGYNYTSINSEDLARLMLASDPETKKIFDRI